MSRARISARIDEVLKDSLFILSKNTSLSVTDMLELSILDFIEKWNGDLEYEGIDFKEYCKSIKSEKLRKIVSKQRQEFLSKELFIPRVYIDIWKLILLKKNLNMDEDIKTVMSYMNLRIMEAKQYKNNEKLLKELDFLKNELEHKKIKEIKTYIIDKTNDKAFLKKITRKKWE